jgi:integrase
MTTAPMPLPAAAGGPAAGTAPGCAPPLPLRAGHTPMAELFDLYMAHYAGRDANRQWHLRWWAARIGALPLAELSDDQVHAALESLAQQSSRYYAGKDAEGRRIYRGKAAQLSPATVNRYAAALSAVITWAIKRRIAPKGYVHPCRSVERRPENNEKTRFLDDDECRRLLDACKASTWPRLYLLVLMALTTGARKGELTGLTWGDLDLDGATATLQRTKNGQARVLPLTPAVVEELRRFAAGRTTRVFRRDTAADKVFRFEPKFIEALRQARIRGATFHTLRHSAASMLARNGATLLEVGDLLGHRQLQTTRRYSHLAVTHKAALVNRVLGGLR